MSKSSEAAERLAELGDTGERLAAAFWPGPLTLVAPRRADAGVADLATAGLDTVALRVPGHPVAAELLAAVPFPLAAPSANLSGRVSATTAAPCRRRSRRPRCRDSRCRPVATRPRIDHRLGRRRSGVAAARRRHQRGDRGGHRHAAAPAGGEGAARRAGHVAEPLRSVGAGAAGRDRGRGRANRCWPSGRRCRPAPTRRWRRFNLSERSDLAEAAAHFFAALRALDDAGAPIAAMPIPEEGLGLAINDRLRRAAAPRP